MNKMLVYRHFSFTYLFNVSEGRCMPFIYYVLSNKSNIWQANTQDLLGNYNNYTTGFNTGEWTTAKTYNQDNGRLMTIITGPVSNRIQDLTYTYDNIGNLKSRNENMYNSILSYQKEDFNYDNLNRLNGITYSNNVSTSPLKTINYDNGGLGNITTMPDVGNFTYDTQRLHAITQITNNPGNINTTQQVDYTSFNKVLKLEDGQSGTAAFKKLMFKYGPDYSRRKTSYYEGTSAVSVDKYFALGCYEEEVNNATGIAVKDFYINAGDGLAAIYRITGTNPGVMYYIHKDNMGSFDKVTNESGAVVDRYSFDAWGNRRNYDNWTLSDNSTHLFSRGYTGHEHLDKFGLINMNGRLYDSKLARFLSPDPFLQDPSNTQNYNRYSFCLNNPFAFTDPSGYTYMNEYQNYQYEQYQMDIISQTNSFLNWESYNAFKALDAFRDNFAWGEGWDGDGNYYKVNKLIGADGSSISSRNYGQHTSPYVYIMINSAGMENTIDTRYSYEDMNYADTDEGRLRAGWGTNAGGMSFGPPHKIFTKWYWTETLPAAMRAWDANFDGSTWRGKGWSVSATLAISGSAFSGITFEFGNISDLYRNSEYFFSWGPAFGKELSLSFNMKIINTSGFNIYKDFLGKGSGASYSSPYAFGFGYFGNPLNGNTYSGKDLSIGFGGGKSVNQTKTIFIFR